MLVICAEPAAAAGGESAPKKAKQQQAKASSSSSSRRPLAVVGDAQLAASRPAIVRELYKEAPELTAMPEDEVQQLLEQRRTAVDGSNLRPVMSFEQTGLPANMLHATRDFVSPSPIQSQVRRCGL
jgi:ATP-dependent RNA helicase DBP3